MQSHNRIALLAGSAVAGLFALVQYGLMARQVPQLLAQPARSAIADGALTIDGDGLWLRAWVGPSLTVPTIVLAVGLLAGWFAPQSPEQPAQAGTRAGAAAGLGALVAVAIVCTALLAWLGADPAVQELVRLSEPDPAARIAPATVPWLGAGVGLLLGLAVGAQSFATALFGGLIADLLRDRADQPTRRATH